MNIDKDTKKHPDDVFDNNFEVIYEGELPELPNDLGNDDYKDVLSNLSELDTTNSLGIDYLEQNRTRTFSNLLHTKTGPWQSRARQRAQVKRTGKDLALQAISLLLIAVTAGLLAFSFWSHTASYTGTDAAASHNYMLGAYYGASLFLLLIEWIAFLNVLLSGSTSNRHGMFSFLLVYAGSLLSHLFAGQIPDSPALLQGLREALAVYGSLNRELLWLCGAGAAVCLIRKRK